MEATTVSLVSYHKLYNPSFYLVAENVFKLPPLASYKTLSSQPINSFTKCLANIRENPSTESHISNRAFYEDDNRIHTSSDYKSRSRERLVALFKRIQKSISEEESSSTSANISRESNDIDSPVEMSVLEFFLSSNRFTKVTRSKRKDNEESTRKRTDKKETPKPIPQPSSDFKVSRLPSNFVKKSPITSPTPLRSTNKEEPNSESERKMVQLEGMKLIELKELAKEKGIKGYSKLKKGELIELLRSEVNA